MKEYNYGVNHQQVWKETVYRNVGLWNALSKMSR
jgi:hypothetical protein